MSFCEIVIGTKADDHLAITPTRYEFPESKDPWDGNWVYATVCIQAGAFVGEFEATLRTSELRDLHRGLTRLYKELEGTTLLEAIDHWLRIQVTGDGRGHFVAECVARDQVGTGNKLCFELHCDQTELPNMLATFDFALAEFPVKESLQR